MPPTVKITLDTRRLDEIQGNLRPRAMAVLDKIALDVLHTAQPETNFDTGALRNSGYVSGASGGGGSTFGAGAAEAQARRPGVTVLDEVTPRGPFERIVGFSVEYAYWQEFSKPFLVPAVEQHRVLSIEAWEALFG